jgi:hypothetical protein
MRRLTFEEILEAPVQVSLLNEAIDYSVAVREETAAQRAHRRWRMEEEAEGRINFAL